MIRRKSTELSQVVACAAAYIGGMDVLNPAFCRTRRLTMTSNAEEQANPPAAATAQPPKATKRADVAPQAPCRARQAELGKEGQLGRTAAQKSKGRQTGQTRRRYPRGEQDSKSPGLAEAAELRFIERTYESHGLVGAFCPWILKRRRLQADEAQARVREERRGGAPLLSQGLNFYDANPNSAAGDFTSPAFASSVSFRDELQIHSDIPPAVRAILGVAKRG